MKYISIIMLGLILLATGCEKNITIPQPEYKSRVCIECGLEVGTVPKVYFYKTVPYFDISSLQDVFVRNAQVKINNSFETDNLVIDSTYNYLKCEYEYFYMGNIPVKQDEDYQLTITVDTAVYIAHTKTNLMAVTIDSVGYTPSFTDIYGDHEGVIPYFHDIPNQTNYYRYEMTRKVDTTMKYREGKISSPCIGDSSIMMLELGRSVYNDQNLNGDQVRLIIEPAYSHYKGLQGTVRIQTIDKATYEFYDQLDKQKLGQLNPFVEPVFLTDGQFGKSAAGYFGSVVKSDPVTFIFPE